MADFIKVNVQYNVNHDFDCPNYLRIHKYMYILPECLTQSIIS